MSSGRVVKHELRASKRGIDGVEKDLKKFVVEIFVVETAKNWIDVAAILNTIFNTIYYKREIPKFHDNFGLTFHSYSGSLTRLSMIDKNITILV